MPGNDLQLLCDAAYAAGDIARTYFQSKPKVWDKDNNAGPVTEADIAVNDMLHETLHSAQPDYGWLSEESEDNSNRLSTSRQFVVDPIDGTRAFIEGAKDWAHSLAVLEGGQPMAAAVYLPLHDQLFSAEIGGGAFLNGAQIHVSSISNIANATALTPKANIASHFWKNAQPPNIKRAFRSSLAYRLCLVGQGRFDAMMTFRPTWEWDIAAGALIVTEAGGIVTDQNLQKLSFNNAIPQVAGVMAGTGAIHQQLSTMLLPANGA